jgi:hypothetical protein
MKAIPMLALLVGCASDPKPAAPPPTPQGCVTLDPSAAQDYSITTDASVCMHLDATTLHRAHFMADLPARSGTTSGFSIVLQDPSGQALVDGWDLTIGETDPRTNAHIEWSPPAGVTTDATLVITAPQRTSSTIDIALFDPLE